MDARAHSQLDVWNNIKEGRTGDCACTPLTWDATKALCQIKNKSSLTLRQLAVLVASLDTSLQPCQKRHDVNRARTAQSLTFFPSNRRILGGALFLLDARHLASPHRREGEMPWQRGRSAWKRHLPLPGCTQSRVMRAGNIVVVDAIGTEAEKYNVRANQQTRPGITTQERSHFQLWSYCGQQPI